MTADADGQHLVGDIVAVAEELSRHPAQLVLGVRIFTRTCRFAAGSETWSPVTSFVR